MHIACMILIGVGIYILIMFPVAVLIGRRLHENAKNYPTVQKEGENGTTDEEE